MTHHENVDLILIATLISREWLPLEEDEVGEMPITTLRIGSLAIGISQITHQIVFTEAI